MSCTCLTPPFSFTISCYYSLFTPTGFLFSSFLYFIPRRSTFYITVALVSLSCFIFISSFLCNLTFTLFFLFFFLFYFMLNYLRLLFVFLLFDFFSGPCFSFLSIFRSSLSLIVLFIVVLLSVCAAFGRFQWTRYILFCAARWIDLEVRR